MIYKLASAASRVKAPARSHHQDTLTEFAVFVGQKYPTLRHYIEVLTEPFLNRLIDSQKSHEEALHRRIFQVLNTDGDPLPDLNFNENDPVANSEIAQCAPDEQLQIIEHQPVDDKLPIDEQCANTPTSIPFPDEPEWDYPPTYQEYVDYIQNLDTPCVSMNEYVTFRGKPWLRMALDFNFMRYAERGENAFFMGHKHFRDYMQNTSIYDYLQEHFPHFNLTKPFTTHAA